MKVLSIYSAIVTVVLAATLFSCKSFDVPSLERFFDNAQKLKTVYCSDMAAVAREKILSKIRESHPEYPEHGFCGLAV